MSSPTYCIVSGILVDPSSTPIEGAVISANIVVPYFVGSTDMIAPDEISTTTDSLGAWSLNLYKGLSCIVTIQYPPNSTDSRRRYNFSIIVPATDTASFFSLVTEN